MGNRGFVGKAELRLEMLKEDKSKETSMNRPDITAARAAWIELGKALDSAEFAPSEARTWQGRAAALGITKPPTLQDAEKR